MFKIIIAHQFTKDLKNAKKRKVDLSELSFVVNSLAEQKTLAPKYRDHKLSGVYDGFRECHIKPDWLLIYRVEKEKLELFLFRTGTHSELF